MVSALKDSWSAFDRKIADIYLDGYGYPSVRSKELMASLLKDLYGQRSFRLADLGCGNGHLYGYFRSQELNCCYTGYDFSHVLLQSASAKYPGDESVRFIEADLQDLEMPAEPTDIALFSHVLEMLPSPEVALLIAKRIAPLVMVRFFEPPEHPHDLTELRMMAVGRETPVPYLRRSMSLGYYNYLLSAVGCTNVDVHQVNGDKDQVHLLTFD
jgi:SAM-dependent methyltransferase